VTAVAVNLAFRLLDAQPLKAALARSPGVLAIIVSSWFFEEVVRHSGTAPGYRPAEVAVKETTTTGWICLPDQELQSDREALTEIAADVVSAMRERGQIPQTHPDLLRQAYSVMAARYPRAGSAEGKS